jgi:hypothetical protein
MVILGNSSLAQVAGLPKPVFVHAQQSPEQTRN